MTQTVNPINDILEGAAFNLCLLLGENRVVNDIFSEMRREEDTIMASKKLSAFARILKVALPILQLLLSSAESDEEIKTAKSLLSTVKNHNA